jgi:hypothetical protein
MHYYEAQLPRMRFSAVCNVVATNVYTRQSNYQIIEDVWLFSFFFFLLEFGTDEQPYLPACGAGSGYDLVDFLSFLARYLKESRNTFLFRSDGCSTENNKQTWVINASSQKLFCNRRR